MYRNTEIGFPAGARRVFHAPAFAGQDGVYNEVDCVGINPFPSVWTVAPERPGKEWANT